MNHAVCGLSKQSMPADRGQGYRKRGKSLSGTVAISDAEEEEKTHLLSMSLHSAVFEAQRQYTRLNEYGILQFPSLSYRA